MTARYLPVQLPRRRLDADEFARLSGIHPELLDRFVALDLVRAIRDTDGRLWFPTGQLAAVARVQRLRSGLSLNYAALGLVIELLDRIQLLENTLRQQRPYAPGHPTVTRSS